MVELHEYTESDDEFVLFMQYCNDAEYFDNKIVEVSDTQTLKVALVWTERGIFGNKCPSICIHKCPVKNVKDRVSLVTLEAQINLSFSSESKQYRLKQLALCGPCVPKIG